MKPKNGVFILLIIWLPLTKVIGQKSIQVLSAKDSTIIRGAHISPLNNQNIIRYTDDNGKVSLRPFIKYKTLLITCIGFQELVIDISAPKEKYYLKENIEVLDEVEVVNPNYDKIIKKIIKNTKKNDVFGEYKFEADVYIKVVMNNKELLTKKMEKVYYGEWDGCIWLSDTIFSVDSNMLAFLNSFSLSSYPFFLNKFYHIYFKDWIFRNKTIRNSFIDLYPLPEGNYSKLNFVWLDSSIYSPFGFPRYICKAKFLVDDSSKLLKKGVFAFDEGAKLFNGSFYNTLFNSSESHEPYYIATYQIKDSTKRVNFADSLINIAEQNKFTFKFKYFSDYNLSDSLGLFENWNLTALDFTMKVDSSLSAIKVFFYSKIKPETCVKNKVRLEERVRLYYRARKTAHRYLETDSTKVVYSTQVSPTDQKCFDELDTLIEMYNKHHEDLIFLND